MTAPSVNQYPLQWPMGFPRARHRERGAFRTDFQAALNNVRRSLAAFAKDSGKQVTNPVMSSNVNPLALQDRPLDDPGVAVWFIWDALPVCIAVDRYAMPAANLQAIHHIIEARRVELRHGTLALVRASLQGFKALPAPKGKHWRDVLELTGEASPAVVAAAYKRLAAMRHPDNGGSDAAMAELNVARDTAMAELKP